MNPLASRKKLLIAESELNRAQLMQEWQTLTHDVHALTNQARAISSFALAASTLIAGLFSLRQKKSPPATEKPSWLQTILKGASAVSTFWSVFNSSGASKKH